jgi:acetylornithine deacetylase/succinyl-diaminopimelate desuccinylase-like protein
MSSEVRCKFDRNKVAVAAIVATLFCSSASLAAQGPPRYFASDERVALDSALKDEDVQAALLHVNEHKAEMTETLLSLARSEAGTGSLRARAELIARRMRDIGLKDVTLDKGTTPNVLGRIKGRSRGAIVFVSTISEPPHVAQGAGAVSHGPRADGERISGPGARGSAPTAALLAAAAALREEGVRPARDLIFATVPPGAAGVEGIKRLYGSRNDKIVAVIEVQGDGASIARAPESASTGAQQSSLVAASVAIVKWLGMEPKMRDATSASTRVAFAGGTPAIVLGTDRDEAHGSPDESADLQSMVRSAKHIVLLAATLR